MAAIAAASLVTSEVAWIRYAGIAVCVYGLLMINWRVMNLTKLLEKKE